MYATARWYNNEEYLDQHNSVVAAHSHSTSRLNRSPAQPSTGVEGESSEQVGSLGCCRGTSASSWFAAGAGLPKANRRPRASPPLS